MKIATALSLTGFALISGLAIATNLLFTPGALWFFYAVYAAAWWPLGVALGGRKKYAAFAAAGSLLTIALMVVTNLVTSPHVLWSLYTLAPLLCWPGIVYLRRKMKPFPLAILFGGIITTYFVVINILFPGYPWALFACFPAVAWPLTVFITQKLGKLWASIVGSFCAALWYGALNLFLAAGFPWVIFVIFAVAWWPTGVYFHGRGKPLTYAIVMTSISAAFFIAVNLICSPGAIWAIYPVFALLWWPVSILFARRKQWFGLALTGSLLTIAFLAAVNIITSPAFPWSAFPSLAILWWPTAVFFARRKQWPGLSVAGFLLATALLVTINLTTWAGFMWSFIPALCILWWPVSVFFARKKQWFAYSLAGSLLIIALLVILNITTSPAFPWSVFPALAILWWPLSRYFAGKRNPLGYSIGGSILAITLFVTINLVTSPGFPWWVFPVFAVLWWPLGVFIHHLGKRRPAK